MFLNPQGRPELWTVPYGFSHLCMPMLIFSVYIRHSKKLTLTQCNRTAVKIQCNKSYQNVVSLPVPYCTVLTLLVAA